jgi:hypothetical protein
MQGARLALSGQPDCLARERRCDSDISSILGRSWAECLEASPGRAPRVVAAFRLRSPDCADRREAQRKISNTSVHSWSTRVGVVEIEWARTVARASLASYSEWGGSA